VKWQKSIFLIWCTRLSNCRPSWKGRGNCLKSKDRSNRCLKPPRRYGLGYQPPVLRKRKR
ncbi:unnamed protein product, partial [Nesidiocoris tenuis]